ncbi:FMN-binding negative transcriptional regulator [Marinomonas sp. 15G1-11]|uniref:FMN-binding negative transcriptional regulator n=1 Tax=Marinomonas phaeophyticola TaxID=3004091 RepID=A0ABT4JWG8_9GAMM|nr:FMN-binding negative transcriptional regulator [Marinomonas sp. 15G1-11]MCZ2722561.1 FMN-binding negative transcriptional regulator [Marinomonas sp. 15G1-11]
MYIPSKFQVTDLEEVHRFIERYGFGIILSDSLEGTHLPFILEKNEGEFGTLYCHFARANPHWQILAEKMTLVVFHGPHAYISPTWYQGKPNVPTWNYTAVHVYGRLSVLAEADVVGVMEKTVKKYEPEVWSDQAVMPEEYREKLQKAIVACKITLTKVEAQYKLGQHRKTEDQQGVTDALSRLSDIDSIALYGFMQQQQIGLGK